VNAVTASKSPPLRLPRLEIGHDDLGSRKRGEVPSRQRRQLFTQLDADEGEPARCECEARLAGSRPDLENAAARRDRREGDEVVEERVRIRGPREVVELGDRPERLAQPHAVPVLSHALHDG
jgi:hypothetical protein